MLNLKDKIVVITGAGSGIGQALSRAMAAEGCRLALADRDPSGLKQTLSMVKGTTAKTWTLDVTRPDAVARFARDVRKKLGPADVVVNNAGINNFTRVVDSRLENMKRVMDVNFWGVIHMTQAFLPQLLARPEASLVNISSTLGLKGFFGQAIYSASKFAVRGFTEALQIELRDSALTITLVYPGGVKTKIHDSAINEYPLAKDELRQAVEEMNAKSRCTPDQAAQAILRGIQRKKTRVLIGIDALAIDWLVRLLPSDSNFLLYLLRKRDPFWNRMKADGSSGRKS